MNNIFGDSRQMYPFVISDVASESRKYTLYASSERERTMWNEVFEETISLRKAWVDANSVSDILIKKLSVSRLTAL